MKAVKNALNLIKLVSLGIFVLLILNASRFIILKKPKPVCLNALPPELRHEKNEAYSRTPTILFLNSIFEQKSDRQLPDEYNSAILNCDPCDLPVDMKCFFSHDQKLHLGTADAVIVQYRRWDRKFPPPNFIRPANQMWTFLIWESPAHVYNWNWHDSALAPKHLNMLSGVFNWTMTYRTDSDVLYTYGRFVRRSFPDYSRKKDRFSGKTKTAVWMVNHCDTMSHRERYVKKLIEAGIDVDMLGSCTDVGNKSFLVEESVCRMTKFFSTHDGCNALLGRHYKFYLSFENSLCRDYVTEKFYRATLLDSIPVVMNGANMSLFAPKRSYIDIRDFSSPNQLALYLRQVAADRDLYNSYFDWKPFYDVEHTFEGMTYTKNLCKLCSKVHSHLRTPKTSIYTDLENWWVKDANCYEGSF